MFRFTRLSLSLVSALSLFVGLVSVPHANAAQTFNVVNYGAVGDGATDDQVALENVFTLASKSPGSIVEFPAGTYLHSGRLSIGADVSIQGTQANLNGTNAGAQALVITGDKTSITGLGFNGQPSGDPAIEFNKLRAITIGSNIFTGFTDDIRFTDGIQINVKNNTFAPGQTGRGVAITASSAVTVQGNTFTGVRPALQQKGVVCTGENILVGKSNTFSNLNFAINGGNTKTLRIDNNTFNSCETDISANGPNMIISNNNGSAGDTFFEALNVGTQDLLVENNTISGYRLIFDTFGGNTNTKVNLNKISSSARLFSTSNNKNITLTGNQITDVQRVFTLSNDTDIKILKNVLLRCAAPLDLNTCRTMQVDSNTVTDSGTFNVMKPFDAAITGNQMTNISHQCVNLSQNSGTSRIDKNVLNNAGLMALFPAAVIAANGSGEVSIVGNSYSGNTTNLTYFIDTTVTKSNVSGNTTNTGLPTKIGF